MQQAGNVTVYPNVEFSHAAAEWPASGGVTPSSQLEGERTACQLDVDTRATLLDTLREQLMLFGAKKGL